ncbi:MAG: hypothetical protein U9Q71_07025 [Pseudomonadota bacterium]|nr:hypothetical protein [Pseudomonadota bacterium]
MSHMKKVIDLMTVVDVQTPILLRAVRTLLLSLLVAVPLVVPAVSFAAEEESEEAGEEAERLNRIAVFAGSSRKKIHTGEKVDAYTWGINYARELNDRFSLGILYEQEGGDIDAWTVIVPAFIRLGERWELQVGPGVEHENETDEDIFLFRAGIGYEFELSKDWVLIPEVDVDWIDVEHGDNTVFVYGVNLGRLF